MQILISISLVTLIVYILMKIKDAYINLNKAINIGKLLDKDISIAKRVKSKEIEANGGLFKLKLASIKNVLLN